MIGTDGLSQAAQRKLPVTANAKRLGLNCLRDIAATRSTFEATPGWVDRGIRYSVAYFDVAVKREVCCKRCITGAARANAANDFRRRPRTVPASRRPSRSGCQ